MIHILNAILCASVGFSLGFIVALAIVERTMKDSQKRGEK